MEMRVAHAMTRANARKFADGLLRAPGVQAGRVDHDDRKRDRDRRCRQLVRKLRFSAAKKVNITATDGHRRHGAAHQVEPDDRAR